MLEVQNMNMVSCSANMMVTDTKCGRVLQEKHHLRGWIANMFACLMNMMFGSTNMADL